MHIGMSNLEDKITVAVSHQGASIRANVDYEEVRRILDECLCMMSLADVLDRVEFWFKPLDGYREQLESKLEGGNDGNE